MTTGRQKLGVTTTYKQGLRGINDENHEDFKYPYHQRPVMSSDMYPERIATYFANMTPLAAKIYADIQRVEESCKVLPNLSYGEKCSVVDKHLIYDLIHGTNHQNGKRNSSGCNNSEISLNSYEKECAFDVFYDDPVLDQDHISALMLSVCPKKPEKYVYDDNNYWIDEHSVSYSCCTESQAKACQLTEFVKALPFPEPKQQLTVCHKKYKAPTKPPVLREKAEVEAFHSENEDYFSDLDNHDDFQQDNDYTSTTNRIENEKQSRASSASKSSGLIGISVMGISGPPPKPPSSASKQQIDKNAQEKEENLPQQKQNSDLIAELQAKLKMSKCGSGGMSSSRPVSGSKSHQVNKPKAPPPPPPKVPGSAMKVSSDDTVDDERDDQPHSLSRITSTKSTGGMEKKSGKDISEDEFIVDISSPCRIATPKTGFDFLDNW